MLNVVTTVVEAASSADLVTLAFVKEELGITATTDDVWLGRAIKRASAKIAQACNRVFVVETVKDEVWPQRDPLPRPIPGGLEILQLSRWPLTETVPIVVENGISLANGVDFRTDATKGQLVRLGADLYPRTWRVTPIAVTFEAGFETIPDDIVDAALLLVKARWFSRKRDPSLKSETIDGVRTASWWISTTATDAMPPEVSDTLNNYRIPVVA